jgi:hypothetical protein
MPRPKLLSPKAHLHITIDGRLREQLDRAVWSEVEGKIPAGALQRFVENRLREYFAQAELDISEYVLGADVVRGNATSLSALKEYLEEKANG